MLLAQGANVMPSLLWPWAMAVPPGAGVGCLGQRPNRSEWLARIGGRAGRAARRRCSRGSTACAAWSPSTRAQVRAWFGITVYWAADMCALWASLRTFGMDLGVGKLIIAYSTGYAATRRSLPLGGAGATEVLMTYALYWVREPLAPALAAVMLYRAFNFLLIAIPALIANRQLESTIESTKSSRDRLRRLRKRAT